MGLKNESKSAFSKTKSFYKEYTADMTRDRLGKEWQADSSRIRQLFKEATGDESERGGEQLPAHVKLMRLFNALNYRLTPTRRLVFGGSIFGYLFFMLSSGLVANVALMASFTGLSLLLVLELLEKFDVKKEIEFARDIQLSLLPQPFFETSELDTASFANTASEVGGDYVDVIETPLGVYVICADVSGKGLSAALYMVRMQAMVHLLIKRGIEGPKALFLELNNFIKSSTKDKTFVTATGAYFPKGENYFLFTRAGHNPPILYNHEKDATFSLRSPGIALGMASTPKLEKYLKEATITFNEGDSVLFYTDGLTEARNMEGDEFGNNRLESIIDIYGGLDAQSIIGKIQSSLESFIGDEKQLDDITFTAVRRKKQPKLAKIQDVEITSEQTAE